MQSTLDSDPDLREYRLVVTTVQVFKKGDETYRGIASIRHDGESHDVFVDILVDGENILWEAPPGSFLFIAPGLDELESAFEDLFY